MLLLNLCFQLSEQYISPCNVDSFSQHELLQLSAGAVSVSNQIAHSGGNVTTSFLSSLKVMNFISRGMLRFCKKLFIVEAQTYSVIQKLMLHTLVFKNY
jgi:hypothetical protein